MGKFTLLWVMFCMAFSIIAVGIEADLRSDQVEKTTRRALEAGLRSGCEELTNPTRQGVQQAITNIELLDIERGEKVLINPVTGESGYEVARQSVPILNCDMYAQNRTERYMRGRGR